jgi:hypothetical protein
MKAISDLQAAALCLVAFVAPFALPQPALADTPAQTEQLAVGTQYGTTHVYVAPADFDRFVASFVATFGGHSAPKATVTVTPTASRTLWQAVITPYGSISVFAFTTPIPYPFGLERGGYLVSNFDDAIRIARENGAILTVAPFGDALGKDAIVEWPGAVPMQIYWHTTALHNAPLATVPENRIYISPDAVDTFVDDFNKFSHGTVVSDESAAPGIEIGVPTETYRRVRLQSPFGKLTLLVTDGHLPYPYGHETTGYEVPNLTETLQKAKAAGAAILVAPYASQGRQSAMVQFPGGYVAEIHALIAK